MTIHDWIIFGCLALGALCLGYVQWWQWQSQRKRERHCAVWRPVVWVAFLQATTCDDAFKTWQEWTQKGFDLRKESNENGDGLIDAAALCLAQWLDEREPSLDWRECMNIMLLRGLAKPLPKYNGEPSRTV